MYNICVNNVCIVFCSVFLRLFSFFLFFPSFLLVSGSVLTQLLREAGTMSSVVYGAMDQEARSIHLDKFRKGKVGHSLFIAAFCLAWLAGEEQSAPFFSTRVCWSGVLMRTHLRRACVRACTSVRIVSVSNEGDGQKDRVGVWACGLVFLFAWSPLVFLLSLMCFW